MTQTEFLLDTLKYYTEDVSRRCVDKDGGCYYNPENAENPNSKGCAIGRFLTKDLQIKLDNISCTNGIDNKYVFNCLPIELQNLGQRFLVLAQSLHDFPTNWNEKGLSDRGREELKVIINTYKLNKEEFKIYD